MERILSSTRPAVRSPTGLFVDVELQGPLPFEWEEHLIRKLRATLWIPAAFWQDALGFDDRRPAATPTHGEKFAVAGRCLPSGCLEFVYHGLKKAARKVYCLDRVPEKPAQQPGERRESEVAIAAPKRLDLWILRLSPLHSPGVAE
jgi:hypothetical protein